MNALILIVKVIRHVFLFLVYPSKCSLITNNFQIFSAAGYRCIAFDMPGCGKTGGSAVPDAEKADVISLAMRAFELESVSSFSFPF